MSPSAPCKNIVRAGRCTVRSLHCVQTHTVIGRISGKGNLRQARAIWGMTRYCEELKRGWQQVRVICREFFLFYAGAATALPAADKCHSQYPCTHIHTPTDCYWS